MSIVTYIQRKFNMAIFKYISRFEDLLEQELKYKNVWTNPNWTVKNFPDKWQTILYSMGCKEETSIFSINVLSMANNTILLYSVLQKVTIVLPDIFYPEILPGADIIEDQTIKQTKLFVKI